MKRILLLILAIGILLLGACGGNGITHYVNEEFGYSLDYPKDWVMEELDEYKIGVMPGGGGYNQIQIDSYVGEPLISSTPESMVASVYEADLQMLADSLVSPDLNISVNEPASGKWDWMAAFTMTSEDTPLQGGLFVKETETITYTIFYIQSTDWPEGQEVIDSFSLTEITETEENNGN
jgi:hypothetical protein